MLACALGAIGLGLGALARPAPPEIRYGSVDPPVIAQRDVTIRHPTSIHPRDPTPQPLECSGLTWFGSRLLLPSDRHGHVVFTMNVVVDDGEVSLELPKPQPIISREGLLLLDAECVTVRPASMQRGATGPSEEGAVTGYVFCSMSNDPTGARRPMREHAARIGLAPDGSVDLGRVSVISLETVRSELTEHFAALGVQPYEAFNSDRGENTARWGSIEGIAWAPSGEQLLCGMRNPLAGPDAIFFALESVDAAFDANDGSLLRIVDLFPLSLGGRGVSDLAWDPVTGGYLITAARSNGPRESPNQPYPLANVDAALFWWSGDKQDPPRLAARLPDMNIDAVCRVGETSLIALGSDEGDVSEERRGHQTAVTLMHFPQAPRPDAATATSSAATVRVDGSARR